jgi:glycerol kinase
MRIAAIDQGTTSTRILVVDEEGCGKVVHAARHGQHHPRPGLVEHDPEELIAHLRDCIAAAGPIDAIGIDNQGESCLAWDRETGEALSPVIVWQDARTNDVIERMKAEGHDALTLERAGLPLDPYFSAAKLRWLLDNNAKVKDALKRHRLRLGTTDAFFLQRLTGRCATDITTASRTSLMNLATGSWDAELCRLFGVPVETLPEIVPTVSDFGGIDGVPITASLVDQQAALYGHGCRKAGDIKITFGTGAFILAVTAQDIMRAPAHGLLPTVAWQIGPERHYAVDGGVYNAGSAIEWAERVGLLHNLEELAGFTREPAIARGLAFVPALSGLAAPHWDRSAAGLFIGLGLETERADLLQAILEGIALRTAEVVDAMAASLPLAPRISIDGGLTRSAYFRQFLADVLGRPLDLHQDDELTAYGTAALAARGLGLALPLSPVAQEVMPRADASKWRNRFSDAISRAKGWR